MTQSHWRATWAGRRRTASGLAALLLARFLRSALPMSTWARLIGSPRPYVEEAVDRQTPLETSVTRVVRRAAARLPLHTSCLDRAVAGQLLLRLSGHPGSVVVGLDRVDPRDGSHAWLRGPSGALLLGGEEAPGFVPITAFGFVDRDSA